MFPVKEILCPTDFSEPAQHALKAAVELARRFDAELLLLNVVDPLPMMHAPMEASSFDFESFEKERIDGATTRLTRLIGSEIPEGLRVRPLVVSGNVPSQIVRIADEYHADLIVIATHGWTGWRRLLFGSVAERVMRTAHCPVCIIHQPRPGAAD